MAEFWNLALMRNLGLEARRTYLSSRGRSSFPEEDALLLAEEEELLLVEEQGLLLGEG